MENDDVLKDLRSAPKPEAFVGKTYAEKESLEEEKARLMRRHVRIKMLTEIIGWCAAASGVFICLSIGHHHKVWVFYIFALLFFVGWLLLRKARNHAGLLIDEFYAEHPAARPSLKYMHPFPERRLVKLLPAVIRSLQDDRAVITYTLPQPIALPLWRGLLVGLLCFIWGVLAFVSIFYVLYKKASFLPSDAAMMSAAVFAFSMGALLLWRWRLYAGKGYVPPEFRGEPRSLHGLSKVFMLTLAVVAAYFAAAHGVMRMLHHDRAVTGVMSDVRMTAPVQRRHGKVCVKLPALSPSRRLLCMDKKDYIAHIEYGTETPRLRLATSAFGTTVEGLEVGNLYFENAYR